MAINGKVLVTYFSASKGKVTERLAKRFAELTDADLFEIVPEKPYSEADLKWVNPLARCNKEKFGKKEVEIAGRVSNIGDYDLILIGFPIWYGSAPNVVNTFVKAHDLSGKKIGLFATSGGSKIGKTLEKMQPYVSEDADLIDAKLFSAYSDDEELIEWVGALSLS
ncbi:MAG: NAD(P)H-dependent oxidoreductase [Lachnospiraceae bacterium]|nr:NAD(P)H-dependent oxidoreductase [Lachnospiraceae bacterium]MBR4777470.1 NAD(P)H-dependent oxidoreductase [Lachnospiraceae bacterium]